MSLRNSPNGVGDEEVHEMLRPIQPSGGENGGNCENAGLISREDQPRSSSRTPIMASRSSFDASQPTDHFTQDEVLEMNMGPPRHASWVLVAWLQLGSTIGAGVLSMASAFAGLGWAMSIFFGIFCCMLNMYCARQLHEASALVPGAHGIVLLSKLVVPNTVYNGFVDLLQNIYLFLTNSAFVLLMSSTLQYVFFDNTQLCRIVWGIIACLVVLPLMQLRNLSSLSWLLWLNLFTFYISIGIILASFIQNIDKSSAKTYIVPPDLNWVSVFNSLSKFSFSYMNTHLTLQFISEMSDPGSFNKAFLLSVPMQLVTYFTIGGIGYYHLGKESDELIVLYMKRDVKFRVASGLLFVHFVVSFLIQGQVLARLLHRKFAQETINDTDFRGRLDWFLVTFSVVISTLFIANAVPVFDQIVSLIGSLTVCLAYVFPLVGIMYARRRAKQTTSTLQHCIYAAIILYSAILFVGGLAAVIMTIIESHIDDAGPFACASEIPQMADF
mmetsp:Transcript_12374/g.24067  ORF Transcript_12374/g.24067 Transcript_12374/m.24067 type:complete len:498 (-) Transcript_12374:126-1619(-)